MMRVAQQQQQELYNDINLILDDMYDGVIDEDNRLYWHQYKPKKSDEPGREPCIDYNYHFFKSMESLKTEDHPLHNERLRYEKNMRTYVDEAREYLEYTSDEEMLEFIECYDEFVERIYQWTKFKRRKI